MARPRTACTAAPRPARMRRVPPAVPAARAAAARPRGVAGATRGRTLLGTTLFVLGFSLVFATEGLAFGGLGLVAATPPGRGDPGPGRAHDPAGAAVRGGVRPLPHDRADRPALDPAAGLLIGAPLLGVLFAVSWTPCVGPTLSVVLSLALTSGTAVRGAVLAFLYGLGLGIPFIIVAFALPAGHDRVPVRPAGTPRSSPASAAACWSWSAFSR